MAESNPKTAIIAEADRIEEDSLYSARGHWESAKVYDRLHYVAGIPATITTALAGITYFSENPQLAVGLAIVSAILVGLTTFLNPLERANAHRQAGNAFNRLRNQTRMFKNLQCPESSNMVDLRKKVQRYSNKRDKLNDESPGILGPAYKRARKGIEGGEATHRADAPKN